MFPDISSYFLIVPRDFPRFLKGPQYSPIFFKHHVWAAHKNLRSACYKTKCYPDFTTCSGTYLCWAGLLMSTKLGLKWDSSRWTDRRTFDWKRYNLKFILLSFYFIPTFTLLGLGYNFGFGRSFGFSLFSTVFIFSVFFFFSGSGSIGSVT